MSDTQTEIMHVVLGLLESLQRRLAYLDEKKVFRTIFVPRLTDKTLFDAVLTEILHDSAMIEQLVSTPGIPTAGPYMHIGDLLQDCKNLYKETLVPGFESQKKCSKLWDRYFWLGERVRENILHIRTEIAHTAISEKAAITLPAVFELLEISPPAHLSISS